MPEQQLSIGRRIDLPAYFVGSVGPESVRTFADGCKCCARLAGGTSDEALPSAGEAAAGFGRHAEALTSVKSASTESIRPFIKSARIRLAYTHHRNFAVSLSGLRTLPHQIEASDRVLVLWQNCEWERGGACTDG